MAVNLAEANQNKMIIHKANILLGDCRTTLKTLDPGSVQTCITSPPYYGLRDYGSEDQIGLEESPAEYIANLVEVFRSVGRVLRESGTVWLNLGDSYNGDKGLIGIPWRVAFALQEAGWWLRQDIIWHKPNPMPESVTDRCTKAHEYIFLLTKNPKYYYDNEAIKEDATWIETRASGMERNARERRLKVKGKYNEQKNYGGGGTSFIGHSGLYKSNGELINPDGKRNKRSVWTVKPRPYKEAHFATYPPELITPCILAGSKPGDTVLDPFAGSGTTGLVAIENSRNFIGCEVNPEYLELAERRINNAQPPLF